MSFFAYFTLPQFFFPESWIKAYNCPGVSEEKSENPLLCGLLQDVFNHQTGRFIDLSLISNKISRSSTRTTFHES